MGRSLKATGVALAMVAAVGCVAAAAPGSPSAPSAETSTPPSATEPSLQTIQLPQWTGTAADLPSMPSSSPQAGGSDAGSAARPVVYTGEIEVNPFELAAVTWQGDGALTAWVRTRSDGDWSQWYELPGEADHAPDAGTGEADRSRNGTDPLIVAPSDAVQVRVDESGSDQSSDIRLDLVNASELATDALVDAPLEQAATEERAFGSASRPTIHRRALWGADESLRAEAPDYGHVRGAFVHHTVSANAYSEADVPSMIRSIYLYHVRSRGWNDIGYNFIVDRFGRIWEGRYGGVDRAVVGAHTYGYNSQAFAMSALGTYTDTPPSASMLRAYQRLFAWKFDVHGVDPRRSTRYGTESWPAIAGHRDAAATACPGDALYAQLGAIRRGTISAMGLVPSRDLHRNWRPDLLATRSDGTLWLSQGRAGGFHDLRLIGSSWQWMSAVVPAGDWDGNGTDDVIARRSADGSLWMYPGRGDGRLGDDRRIGTGWQGMNAIVPAGDWNGDGSVDLIARRASDASLWIYPGRGTGGFLAPRRIGTGWSGMDAILAPGDWTGDGIADIIGRRADGRLWLYPGAGGGAITSGRQIGHGWRGYRMVAPGDVNDDGYADLAAASSTGALLLLTGDGRSGFGPVRTIGSGWARYNRLI